MSEIAASLMFWVSRGCQIQIEEAITGTNYKVANMKQPIKNTYPPDLTVGTYVFVNTNIIEHQHVAGVKSPVLRIIENTKQVRDWKLSNTSRTAHKVFTEL